ncbi:MAG: iron-containing alcohol dehydrogenase [Pontiellaceae bacterium]|nr:iron-containing alcohol dehydrogenase [Pontiellaceae bacterium]
MSGTSLELRKFVAPEFLYGSGALSLAGRYAQNLGGRKALVVTDPGVIKAGWADKVCESLRKEGISTTVFSDVTPNPKDYEVDRMQCIR